MARSSGEIEGGRDDRPWTMDHGPSKVEIDDEKWRVHDFGTRQTDELSGILAAEGCQPGAGAGGVEHNRVGAAQQAKQQGGQQRGDPRGGPHDHHRDRKKQQQNAGGEDEMAVHQQQVDQVDLEALARQLPPVVRGRLPPGFWLAVDIRHGQKGPSLLRISTRIKTRHAVSFRLITNSFQFAAC